MGGLHLGEHIEFVCPLWGRLHLPGKHCCLRLSEQGLFLFTGHWVHTLTRAAKPGKETELVPNSLSNCRILGLSHRCFIHDDGHYPFSTQQVKAKRISLKPWFDRSAKLLWHWVGTKSIGPAEPTFNPSLLVSDPAVMRSRGESFCLADLVDKSYLFFSSSWTDSCVASKPLDLARGKWQEHETGI